MVIERAKQVLKIEADAVFDLINKVNENFVRAVEILSECQGKVIITGIGKSGIISQKIASTLASTGTPAFFLHPAEGIHGDLGMIGKRDVIVAVSNSGETNEIAQLLPLIKRIGIKLIVMTGNLNSLLAQSGDVVIDIGVKEEACPLGLVPTASSTAALAMGDALALALLEKRGFEPEDFALLHPGGSLGKKLIGLRVVSADTNTPCTFRDSILRNSTLAIGFFFYKVPWFGWIFIALISIFELIILIGSRDGMRFGDEIAKTKVVTVGSAGVSTDTEH